MAFSEPLAVAINAINRAGSLLGKKVLVTGAGPIGCLLVAACRAAGASEIVASDLVDKNRELAITMGADSTFNLLPMICPDIVPTRGGTLMLFLKRPVLFLPFR